MYHVTSFSKSKQGAIKHCYWLLLSSMTLDLVFMNIKDIVTDFYFGV